MCALLARGKATSVSSRRGPQFLVWWKGYRRSCSGGLGGGEGNILDAQLIKDFEAQRAPADARDDEPAPDAVDEDVIDEDDEEEDDDDAGLMTALRRPRA